MMCVCESLAHWTHSINGVLLSILVLASKLEVLWNPSKTSLERSGWIQADFSGQNWQNQMWGESHVVLAKSSVLYILVKRVCTVLALHIHPLWDPVLRLKRRLLFFLVSLSALLSSLLTPTGKTVPLSLVSPGTHAWLWSCAQWLVCMAQNWNFSLGRYSTTFRTKEELLVDFSPLSEGIKSCFLSLSGMKKTCQFTEHCSRHCTGCFTFHYLQLFPLPC